MCTRMVFLKVLASVVIWSLHVRRSVTIPATSVAPGRTTLLANTWIRKIWRAVARLEPPPMMVSELMPAWRELTSLNLLSGIDIWALAAYRMTATRTQFGLMLNLVTRLLTKFRIFCQSFVDLDDASSKNAKSMLQLEHSERNGNNKVCSVWSTDFVDYTQRIASVLHTALQSCCAGYWYWYLICT